jgi:hypothetical protein
MLTIEQKLVNQIQFMKQEMKLQDKKIQDLQSAFKSSQETTTSLLRFMEPTNPILAYQLRCMRLRQETVQLRKARALMEETFSELAKIREEKKRLMTEVKEIKRAASKFLEENSRASTRSLAAENAMLKAKLLLRKKYIKKV